MKIIFFRFFMAGGYSVRSMFRFFTAKYAVNRKYQKIYYNN